jgi:hypothetical protein
MPKGKPWTVKEEKQLRQMLKANKSIGVIAKALGKSVDSVRKKIARLELVVVQPKSERTTTSNLVLPEGLPSVKEQLKVLSAVLKELETPGLEQSEVLRLRSIIQGVKIYQELFVDYVDYRGIEAELVELRQKYEELAKEAEGNGSRATGS